MEKLAVLKKLSDACQNENIFGVSVNEHNF